ncbi:RelA/SpoT family protein [bacterium]|nr:RelA/SpoT family protein [bacterium]
MVELKEIHDAMRHPTDEGKALVARAYAFAEVAHAGQERFSGEPYFSHAAAVGLKLANLELDAETIAAGLLHDTLEDGHVAPKDLEKEFGKDILFLVEGVTKLGKLKYRGIDRHAESLRKLFVASAKDIRVLLIKFADRLHNVKTLEHVRSDKRQRIALETLEIYAPLADRLGMGRLRSELEEYSFPWAFPEEYKKIEAIAKSKRTEAESRLKKFYRSLKKELAKEGYANAKTTHRIKGTYSLYKKLNEYGMDISKIYDILAIRIMVPTVTDCYLVLGLIHGAWRPLPGRIKDYIAFPKPNGYRSLHTTVLTGDGDVAEIQIRTEEMHREAELGVAAHFGYKDEAIPENGAGKNGDKIKRKLARFNKKFWWVRELLNWHKETEASGEFLKHLKMDFFKNRVFVFTPTGDVMDLPVDSSPIDFAYAIHSDIGDHAFGAKVNQKLVPLDTHLRNGDIVHIETKKSSYPTTKWLDYAKTTVARRHIRNALEKRKKS